MPSAGMEKVELHKFVGKSINLNCGGGNCFSFVITGIVDKMFHAVAHPCIDGQIATLSRNLSIEQVESYFKNHPPKNAEGRKSN